MARGTGRSWKRTVGTLLVVALVALAGCGAGGGDAGDGGAGGDGASGVTATAGDGGDGGGSAGVGSFYDSQGDRVVVRDARLDLEVESFEEAFRSARSIAREYGGYVGDREQSGEGEYDEGYFVVRVPAENFSTVRDALAGLGTLDHEEVRVLEFTGELRSARSRLEELEADERRLERALENANGSGEVDDIYEQLRTVRERRREAASESGSIARRASFSTIRVEVSEPATHRPDEGRGALAGLDEAFVDAFSAGLATVRLLVVAVGYAIPVGAVAVVGGAGGLGLLAGYRRFVRPNLPPLRGRGGSGGSGAERSGGPTPESEGEDGRRRPDGDDRR
jgi:hypothetical protein